MDSSGSLAEEYDKEKNFIKALASTFGISKNGSRASVITFSEFSEHSIKLNDHDNIHTFNKAVEEIPLMGSITRIDDALRLTQKEMFSIANGGRPGVPKILILLTDGSQTGLEDAENPIDISKELRASGMNIITVGIGNKIDKTELNEIAGSVSNSYNVDSFDELLGNDFLSKLKEKGCKTGM